MRFISLHSNEIEVIPKKIAIKNSHDQNPEEIKENNCLCIFIAFEEGDSEELIPDLMKNIKEISEQIKCDKIVLYPWVHITNKPCSPKQAKELLEKVYENLKNQFEVVKKAPFGWYKEFRIHVKGHPLAELSRTVEKTQKEEQKEEVRSWWYVLDENGLHEADKYDMFDSMKIFYTYETTPGSRKVDKEPIHIEYMRKIELVDYEPASDGGNLRWYPKGIIIKRSLEKYVRNLLIDYGGMEVETPLMFDFEYPAIQKHLGRFPERQYIVLSGKKKLFLRYAACFGQFLMKKDIKLTYKHLPLRLFEITRYSFRREKSGELAGLRRLRAFTMPDMHTLCKDIDQAWEEFKNQVILCKKFMDSLGIEYDMGWRVVKDFYEKYEDKFKEIQSILKKPILIEMWDKQTNYFITKIEFSVNDSTNKAATLATVQIDVENCQKYGIKYVDSDNKEKTPLLLHTSVSGAIERVIWALLEHASDGKEKPSLPVWLSPIQVRFLPVSDEYVDYCLDLVKKLNSIGIRADVDDTQSSIGKKIRNAEREWIPYIVVVGEKEIDSGLLSVRVRNKGIKEISFEDLKNEVLDQINDYPKEKLCLPVRLSLRPKFYGG